MFMYLYQLLHSNEDLNTCVIFTCSDINVAEMVDSVKHACFLSWCDSSLTIKIKFKNDICALYFINQKIEV